MREEARNRAPGDRLGFVKHVVARRNVVWLVSLDKRTISVAILAQSVVVRSVFVGLTFAFVCRRCCSERPAGTRAALKRLSAASGQ